METSDLILTALDGGILTLTMNRPEKKNALSRAMYTALAERLWEADQNEQVRVILITGSGGCFTSGNDLADFLAAPPTGMESPVMQFLLAVSQARKPLLAAVQGDAVGIGVTMLLHCDLVYAGDSARLQLPFVSLGLCPEAGSSLLLPRTMGHQRAAELLLLGEPFTAMSAWQVGIVNQVCRDEELPAFARARARQLAAQPAAAVRLAKELLKRDAAGAVQEMIMVEGERFIERLKSPEAAEALQAFMERRKPDFSRFA